MFIVNISFHGKHILSLSCNDFVNSMGYQNFNFFKRGGTFSIVFEINSNDIAQCEVSPFYKTYRYFCL